MKILKFVLFLYLNVIGNVLFSQGIEEELGFIYVKAEYMYGTNRYDDAILQYNQVISKNPRYKDALTHRGWCKYNVAAYKGALLDAIQSIELNGIQAPAAALLARAQTMLNDKTAATNSLSAAIGLDDQNSDYYEWRAELYEDRGEMIKACNDYESAMKLGSKTALMKAKSLCGISGTVDNRPKKQNHDPNPTTNQPNGSTHDNDVEPSTTSNDEPKKDPVGGFDTSVPPAKPNGSGMDSLMIDDSDPVVIDESIPKEDNTVNALKIDDDLSIDIYGQELGNRKIDDTPTILMLNEQNGKVTIHICVNKEGQVTKAEFNPDFSTISKKSIVSLFIRKAKEFVFAQGKYDVQCGIMIFKITGS